MDFLDRERDFQHLEHAVRCAESGSWQAFSLAIHAYMQANQARLSEKRYNMAREDELAGEAKEYPYSLLGIDERIAQFEKQQSELWDRLKRVQSLEARKKASE